ncbi:MAG: peptide ABC transporter substrate-binding protein [Rhodospirillaceae bacterium]|nr:peptide ABC transporter substrate-binding protein [Rhodospirillaceae bacterium]MBT6138643.1 peptide ABC transporter substrate-binding protein [Rhodospirillaceae bacterium]
MRARTLVLATAAVAMFASAAQAGRGTDGQLKILYWQAPSILNPFLSGGTKDVDASSIIIEPLAHYDEKGNIVAALAESVPTVANGGVAKDLKSITWQLKKGVVWSDGTPFTAADVEFTADYCLHPEGGCNAAERFQDVTSVKAVGSHTVKITFGLAKPFPYGPFVGSTSPVIQKAQFKDCMGAKAPTCTKQNFGTIGTGPFKVKEFKPNDVVLYVMNENYRDKNLPAFDSVLMKGGGDAVSAARAVLETGEFDYAWNLQVEPEILSTMAKAGKGKVISAFGTSVERLMVQLTNPDSALGDKRATYQGGKNPHPFNKDPAVRRALSMAIDRAILVDAGYGPAGQVTCNVLPAPAIYASTANDWCKTQDTAGANKLLDDAGWKRGSDGVRAKDGVRLSLLYQTSTNSVRQGTQALIKQMWQAIGVETELKNISASVFFGGDQSSPDTFQKNFTDIEMYTNNFNGTDPESYMLRWTCDKMPSPATQWIGQNMPRYCDPKYDQLAKDLAKTAATAERAIIAKKMNDMLIEYGAIIPLIHRGAVAAHALSLGGVKQNVWDATPWNIQDWHRK